MAVLQLNSVASMKILSVCDEILSNPGFIASYRIIIVNNGFRACKQHRTHGKVYRHPPPPTIDPEELYINENFCDHDSSITGPEIKCGTDKHAVV
jgi:hypothetical protein